MTEEEFGDEFEEEFAYVKEKAAVNDEELLLRMKKRIINSYRWREDVIIPFSEELKIPPEELAEILMKRLDMSSLEALQPRFESSRYRCIKERIHTDLSLCWLCDVINILTEDEAEKITNKIAFEVLKEDKSYEDALEDGRKELLEYLKR
jgi:energy-converting hydrogenase A subunit M